MKPSCRLVTLALGLFALPPQAVSAPAASASASSTPAPGSAGSDRRVAVLEALKQELGRSRERLKLTGEDPPYFIRYLVREYDDYDMSARFGAVLEDSYQNVRQVNAEVRVGDYHFDNTADDSTEKMFDLDDLDRYEPPVIAPIDDDSDALRATLWLQTDAQYKRALSLLHKKRGNRVTKVVEDESVGSFSKETPERAMDRPVAVKVNRAAWEDRLRRASAVFKSYPDVFDAQIKLSVNHQTRYVVTTEGTELVNERLIWGLQLQAAGRASDGLLVSDFRSFYGGSEGELPNDQALVDAAHQLAREVGRLRQAPMMDPFNG